MGVALLGGFGDLNVDRSARDGDPSQKNGGGAAAGAAGSGGAPNSTSTSLVLAPTDLMKLRVPELKKKLVEAGVDLANIPRAVEKKVRVKLPGQNVAGCVDVLCLLYSTWMVMSCCVVGCAALFCVVLCCCVALCYVLLCPVVLPSAWHFCSCFFCVEC